MDKAQKALLTQRLKTITAKRYEVQSQLDNPDVDDEIIDILERKLRSLDAEIGLLRTQIDYYPKAQVKRGRPRKERLPKKAKTPTGRGRLLKRPNNIGAQPYKTHIQNSPHPQRMAVIADLKRVIKSNALTDDERTEIEADIAFWQGALSEVSI